MSVEEWWGRTFERRGSVHGDNRPDTSWRTIRKLSTEHVAELVRSEGERSVGGLLAKMELRRRENWTARAALVVSIGSLVLAMIAFGLSIGRS